MCICATRRQAEGASTVYNNYNNRMATRACRLRVSTETIKTQTSLAVITFNMRIDIRITTHINIKTSNAAQTHNAIMRRLRAEMLKQNYRTTSPSTTSQYTSQSPSRIHTYGSNNRAYHNAIVVNLARRRRWRNRGRRRRQGRNRRRCRRF